LIRLVTLGRDEGAGGGAGGERGVDVDEPWTTRIEANRDSGIWVLDLDLPLAVQREGTRSSAKVDGGAVLEKPRAGNRNNAEKTGRDRDRHRS
jgi:hypothetical protein